MALPSELILQKIIICNVSNFRLTSHILFCSSRVDCGKDGVVLTTQTLMLVPKRLGIPKGGKNRVS